MKVLDLCSGLGGFSEAFVAAGHEVLRIEHNPLLADVPHTKICLLYTSPSPRDGPRARTPSAA